MCYSRSGDEEEASRRPSKTSAPPRPRQPLNYTPNSDNNSSSNRAGGKAVEPSRAAPAPPNRPAQPAAYSVSSGVAILPARAAPTPPSKPPQPSQPPAKPPRPGASDSEPLEPLDPRRLRPVAASKPDANRPPLPQKPTVS